VLGLRHEVEDGGERGVVERRLDVEDLDVLVEEPTIRSMEPCMADFGGSIRDFVFESISGV